MKDRSISGNTLCKACTEKTSAYLAALNELIENAAEVVDAVKEGAGMTLELENKAALDRIDEEIIELQEAALALQKAKQRMEIGAAGDEPIYRAEGDPR